MCSLFMINSFYKGVFLILFFAVQNIFASSIESGKMLFAEGKYSAAIGEFRSGISII